ncbi:hypothetical protein [Maribacter sp. 2210JD10-5]|uniref:hypothetical protein n=1 Tax=Maribacter sp. 2210JD10-5 TaxID=3386272 RepID=UPI0039BC2343
MNNTRNLFFITLIIVFTACKNENGYPKAVVDNIVNGCKRQARGNDGGLCDCMAEKVQEKYTYEEFKEVENKMASGKQDKAFMEFAEWAKNECGAEITGD